MEIMIWKPGCTSIWRTLFQPSKRKAVSCLGRCLIHPTVIEAVENRKE
jgi:hypothetical protein